MLKDLHYEPTIKLDLLVYWIYWIYLLVKLDSHWISMISPPLLPLKKEKYDMQIKYGMQQCPKISIKNLWLNL